MARTAEEEEEGGDAPLAHTSYTDSNESVWASEVGRRRRRRSGAMTAMATTNVAASTTEPLLAITAEATGTSAGRGTQKGSYSMNAAISSSG